MTTHPTLKQAILYLAGRCDGATSRDDAGYNKGDAAYGARLAVELEAREAEQDEQIVMLEVLRKYAPHQLAPAGITLPSYRDLCEYLGRDPNGGSTPEMRRTVLNRLRVAETRRRVGERAAEEEQRRLEAEARRKAEREAAAIAPDAAVRTSNDGERLYIFITKNIGSAFMPNFGAVLSAVKAVPERRYSPEFVQDGRTLDRPNWTVPLRRLVDLHQALSRFSIDWEPGLEEEAEAMAALPPPPPPPPGYLKYHSEALFAMEFPYDPDKLGIAQRIPGRVWGPQVGLEKCHYAPLSSLPAAAEAFPDFEIDERLRAMLAEGRERAKRLADEQKRYASLLLSAVEPLDRPLGDGNALYQHQQNGVRWLLERSRGLLQFETGTGKTRTALVAARPYNLPVFVICPASVKENWAREAAVCGVRIELYSWAKVPQVPETDFVLICDEAHNAQTWGTFGTDPKTGKEKIKGSQRTAKMVRLARSERCRALFMLTATPIKNGRPVNAYPLLHALRHPIAENKRKFEERYCAAKETRWTRWDTSGAAFLDELHRLTRDVFLQAKKRDCLDLPPYTEQMLEAELSVDAKRTYHETIRQMRDEYDRRVAAGIISSEGEHLALLTQCRVAASIAKSEFASEFAQGVIDEGNQIVVFTSFQESARRIARALGCEQITGETPAKDRQSIVDRLNSGERRALVVGFGAGGEGLNMTSANYALLVDRPWTPGGAEQARGRIERLGQKRAMSGYWLQAFEVDRKIDAILQQKQERIDLVLDGKRRTLRGVRDLSSRDMLRLFFDEEK